MNELKEFDFEGNRVRTVMIEDEPYFVGKDVADVLGYKDLNRAINRHVDREDRKSLSRKASADSCINLWTNKNDFSKKIVINESGVYALIFGSELPSANKFKRWVTHEVLPSIRKHGAYLTDQKAYDIVNNPNNLVDLLQQAADQLKAKDIQIKEMEPKAQLADAITASEATISISTLAKLIKRNGIDIGRNRFFAWLRDNNYLIKLGVDYNLPTQRSMELGLFEINEKTFVNQNGNIEISKSAKVTGKGQQYFINKFLQGQF